jgi:hypothetical protein
VQAPAAAAAAATDRPTSGAILPLCRPRSTHSLRALATAVYPAHQAVWTLPSHDYMQTQFLWSRRRRCQDVLAYQPRSLVHLNHSRPIPRRPCSRGRARPRNRASRAAALLDKHTHSILLVMLSLANGQGSGPTHQVVLRVPRRRAHQRRQGSFNSYAIKKKVRPLFRRNSPCSAVLTLAMRPPFA